MLPTCSPYIRHVRFLSPDCCWIRSPTPFARLRRCQALECQALRPCQGPQIWEGSWKACVAWLPQLECSSRNSNSLWRPIVKTEIWLLFGRALSLARTHAIIRFLPLKWFYGIQWETQRWQRSLSYARRARSLSHAITRFLVPWCWVQVVIF